MARTLAGEPDLLVLDEPNAGVDLISQQAIADALATLAGRGATIVVVLHELGPFAPMIDRTIVLREGRICYDGPPSRLDAAGPVGGGEHCEPSEPPVRVPPMTGLLGEER
jgi:zinc transport system ATP-binding protein